MSAPWNIQLLGGVSVTGPAGSVPIPSRKAKALIALLALSRGMAVSRSRLAEDLWPRHERKQQLQNLRALIRIANLDAGETIISADRETCRLAFEEWKCDAVDVLARGETSEELLAPECPEEALDSWRNELRTEPRSSRLYASIDNLLDWAHGADLGRGLDILFSVREALPNLPGEEAGNLIRKALTGSDTRHSHHAWGVMQLAATMMWTGDTRLAKEAKSLLRSVSIEEDSSAWTSAVFSTASVIMIQGNFARAEALLDAALKLLRGANKTEEAARLRHGLAHVRAYSGDLESAIKILRSLGMSGEPVTDGVRLAHLCIYAAISGNEGLARQSNERLHEFEHYLADPRLQTQLLSARICMLFLNGRREEAREVVLEVLEIAREHQIRIVEIHSLESLAVAGGDEGAEFGAQAVRLRRELGFPRLPIDDIRAERMRR